MTAAAVIILLSYLVGSFPTGFLIGRMRGIDVRHHGSGNIGATNVLRILGRGWGALVFAIDAGKGWFAVWLAEWVNAHCPRSFLDMQGFQMKSEMVLPPVVARILGAIWAMIGHSFTVWLDFKGGKGVATSLGALIGLTPAAAVIGFGLWVLVFIWTRYVSVASLAASAAIPVLVVLTVGPPDRWPLFGLTILLAAMIFWRHRTNIRRLMNGTEHRFDPHHKHNQ